MRVVKSVHALHQNRFGNLQRLEPGTKLHVEKSSHKINRARVDPPIGAGSKTGRPAIRRSHPAAKTGVAKCSARSPGADSPHRQLPTVFNRPKASEIIVISDDSADESGPDDFDLEAEFGDRIGAVDGDDTITDQGGKRNTSPEHTKCVICSDIAPQENGRHCRGSKKHFYCLGCLRNLIAVTFSESRTTIRCRTGLDICSAPFSSSQLHFLKSQPDDPGDESRLEQIIIDEIQRESETVIKNDAKCPFCTWSELYPDIEEKPVFDCRNPKCRASSCRRCLRQAHPGHGCNETTVMSLSESKEKVFSLFCEGLSAAVIRKCNKCEAKFTLGEACNKITCIKCHNKQCYVCHENLARDAGYSHFGEGNEIGKCPLHRNTPLLHCENKIKSLPITAKKISTDFPDLAPLVPEVYTKLREELDKESRSLCRN